MKRGEIFDILINSGVSIGDKEPLDKVIKHIDLVDGRRIYTDIRKLRFMVDCTGLYIYHGNIVSYGDKIAIEFNYPSGSDSKIILKGFLKNNQSSFRGVSIGDVLCIHDAYGDIVEERIITRLLSTRDGDIIGLDKSISQDHTQPVGLSYYSSTIRDIVSDRDHSKTNIGVFFYFSPFVNDSGKSYNEKIPFKKIKSITLRG